MQDTIGFIGAGNLAEAMIRGLRAAGVEGSRILATTRSRQDRLDHLRQAWGIVPVQSKAELIAAAPILVLAMKPQDLDPAMAEVQPHVTGRHVVITVLAGVRCARVESYLNGTPVVRAMPNLPMAVQAAATAVAYGRNAGNGHRERTKALFDLLGHTVEVSEDFMDAVTAVAGSGPAYVYLLMEALLEGAKEVGLPPDVARDLAVQTFYGAAKLVKETDADPADLRRRVTSPGGTTAAAMSVFESRGVKDALIEGVRRATERSKELGTKR
jgi:pyrroline-5-carboxylate reductase